MIGYLLLLLMFVLASMLIVLVLIQRGRGGGLAGAFGGLGGQSAFGAKAGDVFTKITVGLAAVWIAVCIGASLYFSGASDQLSGELGGAAIPALPEAPAGGPSGVGPAPTSPSATPPATTPPAESAPAADPVSEQPAALSPATEVEAPAEAEVGGE